ncbi:pentatricopeptide repeat-containing protein At3g29230-like isoform X2 [Andrographis paniculata]|uniref:pentatricopeptide repeat-containing protein At3g29230-like isoform X2 n=1 Tax=Andrographis paniculata TaxID=175694 RepID=UPI0021E853BB|nr:pentatricopeptide repeat-containing protein At3g29230-like isoform X2 [Andrographis paniculata]
MRCSELKEIDYARQVFDQMPDRRILGLREGEEVHCLAVKNGFKANTYVATSLIELYSGAGCVECAYKVFLEMVVRNVVSWTAMVNGFVGNDDLVRARELFDLAPERDVVLWNRMVTAYAARGDMIEARNLFDAMPGKDLMAWNTLLNGYAGNGDVEGCKNLFESMRERNVFSWNAVIGGFARKGCFVEVLDMFERMLKEASVEPNDATVVTVLTSCARLGALEFGERVHDYADGKGLGKNIYVCNGLVDMYAKCGAMDRAVDVFEKMAKRDLISWNTAINALAVHGDGGNALRLFDEMKIVGERPDGVTFIGILCACSHMGLVKDGLDHFRSMTSDYSIEPRIEHYGCVVDLLARNGLLREAFDFVRNLPFEADGVIWTALLAASRVHKKIEFAEVALEKLVELDPRNPANYVMLSNVYGEARNWGKLARLKVAVRDTGSKKVPGWSSIETVDGVAMFYSFDERNPQTDEIFGLLRGLTTLLGLPMYEFDLVEA